MKTKIRILYKYLEHRWIDRESEQVSKDFFQRYFQQNKNDFEVTLTDPFNSLNLLKDKI